MRSLPRFLALLLLIFSGPAVMLVSQPARAQAPDREFTIAVGETLTFSGRGVTRVTLGLSTVADAKATRDGRQIIVTGKSPGVTTINIFSNKGQKTLLIRVVPVNPVALAEEVREVLGKHSGVDVRVVKGMVLLEGEVASKVFKRKILKLAQMYPNQVLNFTTFRQAFVEGARMVALDVYFIQLSTTNRDNLGVQWNQFFGMNYTMGSGQVPLYYKSSDVGPGVLPKGKNNAGLPYPTPLTGGTGLNSYWSLVGNLNMALDFLVENGLIKTIKHGTIVTETGTLAQYHTGGELLIPIGGLGSSGIQKVPYGLFIKVKPILDFQHRVKLVISAKFSDLDYANGVQGMPALRDTNIQAVVNMMQGQSVLVNAQNNVINTSNENGWWMLGRIPILGWLFKSRNYYGTALNNALFVTPRLYEPGGKVHKALIQGIFEGMLSKGADPQDLPELSNSKIKP